MRWISLDLSDGEQVGEITEISIDYLWFPTGIYFTILF